MNRTPTDLKAFGRTMAIAFGLFAAFFFWRGKPWAPYVAGVSAIFLVLAYTAPKLLGPIEKGWMAFGERMSVVMTFLLLNMTYFLVITPIALILRLMGKDLLSIKLDKTRETYWEDVDPNGPGSRHYLPY